jgi:hypothetical protein
VGDRPGHVDVIEVALTHGEYNGAPALWRDVFDAPPATGRLQTALLVDGNAGLGGDPAGCCAVRRSFRGPEAGA